MRKRKKRTPFANLTHRLNVAVLQVLFAFRVFSRFLRASTAVLVLIPKNVKSSLPDNDKFKMKNSKLEARRLASIPRTECSQTFLIFNF